MSFVLQPFNYFDSDPSQHADDSLNVLAATDTGRLIYQRHGDLSDPGDITARDVECLPVMVRKSAASATHCDKIVMTVMMMTMTVCGIQ